MSITVLKIDIIVSDPDIRQGRPVVAGTGICVSDIVASHLYRGFSPDALAVQFKLSLGEIHAALAYYYMHRDEIDDEMRQRAATADKLLADLEARGNVIRLE